MLPTQNFLRIASVITYKNISVNGVKISYVEKFTHFAASWQDIYVKSADTRSKFYS